MKIFGPCATATRNEFPAESFVFHSVGRYSFAFTALPISEETRDVASERTA